MLINNWTHIVAASLLALGIGWSTMGAAPAQSATNATEIEVGVAVFAGGCFWCTESDFDKVPGVLSTVSGYTGGTEANPTYKQVSSGKTGHIEAVRIEYDPKATDYAKLLDVYWHSIDPVAVNRQFCDPGPQYRSAIFYQNDEQKMAAAEYKSMLQNSGQFKQDIATEILPASDFYPAEEYHQNYHNVNPIRYKFYRSRCGRDQRLEEVWGKKAT